ncbi:MAG: DUF5011 domain-containing protein [Candidatus Yonathbacteria bacterium]|nr:DUF5011 domain-containing protein [Candidatus Yonathbacteria bacterium]
MYTISRTWAALLAAQLLVAPLAVLTAPSVASATVACTPENTSMYVVAHADDSLLFQSPDLYHDLHDGKCVKTIFTTAGDAGAESDYWLAREEGAKAAYAHMVGVSNVWNTLDVSVLGRTIPTYALQGAPNVTLVFLHLPDGGVNGEGFGSHNTMEQLWSGSTSTLTPVDDSWPYTRGSLIDTLRILLASSNPSRINTQDFVGTFGDGDHSDHYATAKFMLEAHKGYITEHVINAYLGYRSNLMPENVTGDDFTQKSDAFFAYTPHDISACQSYEDCGVYAEWLNRQYIVGSETGGSPDMCDNFDGTQTVVPEGYQANGGQCVVKPEVCQLVVSDTSDMVDAEMHAVEAYVSPLWTATANIPGASWIWNAFHTTNPADGETVVFTKHISVTGTPTSASITISTDDNYKASLNGVSFAETTDVDNYSAGKEDTYDVSSLLQTGDNTLVITVENIATGDTNPEVNPAGLRYRLNIVKSSCDTTGPVISEISATPNITSAQATWTTDEPGSSQVEYGEDTSYGSTTTLDTTLMSAHTAALSGLKAGTVYHFRVISTDASGNTTTSSDGTFTTLPVSGNTAPTVTLKGSNPLSIYVGDAYVEAGATATDAQDGELTPVISGTVNAAVVGSYTLTYTATDSGSLTGSATRTVSVIARGGGSSSGGGGGVVFIPGLQISNKTRTVLKPSGNILVAWNTNLPAYGHVVYGVDTGTSYVLDITKPNFGYPQSTPTDPSIVGHEDPQGKIMNHSYVLAGLIPGKTYRYRAISHASPAIMTEEDTFTVPADATFVDETTGIATTEGTASDASSTGGVVTTTTDTSGATVTSDAEVESSASETSIDQTDENTTEGEGTSNGNLAAAAFVALNALAGVKLWQWAILVLAIGGAIYFIIWKRKKDEEQTQ